MATRKAVSPARAPAKAVKKAAAKAVKTVRSAKPNTKKKPKKVPFTPKGYHSLTPSLIVRDADAALAFYAKAFGAKQTLRMEAPDGSVMHAEMKIGDSFFMLGEENPAWNCQSPLTLGGSPTQLMIYAKDAEAAVQRAVDAGAELTMPVTPMFWGDRYGKVKDPFGHQWGIATHFEDVGPKELKRRGDAWMKEMAEQGG